VDSTIDQRAGNETRASALLDFWGDNLVLGALLICITAGWSTPASARTWIWALGASAVAGSLGSAAYVYWHTLRHHRGDGPLFTSVSNFGGGGLTRIMDALARRDFIYLVVLFAVFGKASWFVALAAVGSPLFLVLLLWNGHQERHPDRHSESGAPDRAGSFARPRPAGAGSSDSRDARAR